MKGMLLAIAFVVAAGLFFFGGDGSGDPRVKSLARAEALSGRDELGTGDCRVVNTLAALDTPGPYLVYGTIRDSKGEYRHLWALDAKGRIIDYSCPPDRYECSDRGYRAMVRVQDMSVVWTSPGDESWKSSHEYAVEFVAARRSLR